MKAVATVAILAGMAGSAAAQVGFSGQGTFGYHDQALGSFFGDIELTATATLPADDRYSLSVSYGFDMDFDGGAQPLLDPWPTVVLSTPWLRAGGGALEYAAIDHVNIIDGMRTYVRFRERESEYVSRVDLALALGAGGLRASFAAETDGFFTGPWDYPSYGLSGEFGRVRFGLGYETFPFDEYVLGASAGLTLGGNGSFPKIDLDATYRGDSFSYATAVATGIELGEFLLRGYYAFNRIALDTFGVSLDWSNGPLAIGVFLDGDVTEFLPYRNYGVDVLYQITPRTSLGAGWADRFGTYVYARHDLGRAQLGISWSDYLTGGPADLRDGVSVWVDFTF